MINSRTDNHIQKHLFELLFIIRAKMKDIIQDADVDLTPLQILILRTLVEEGEIFQGNLVKKLGRDKSQITRLVQELESKGLLIKERDIGDRRSFILKPITEVQEKISYFIEKEKALVSGMLCGISQSDIDNLESLLIRMKKNIQK